MKNSRQIIAGFPVKAKGYSDYSGYVQFAYTPGRRYKIIYKNKDGEERGYYSSGTALTYSRDNVKYGVLQKRYFGNLNEAIYTAALWQTLVDECPYNRWKYIYNKFIVWDTYTDQIVNPCVIL